MVSAFFNIALQPVYLVSKHLCDSDPDMCHLVFLPAYLPATRLSVADSSFCLCYRCVYLWRLQRGIDIG